MMVLDCFNFYLKKFENWIIEIKKLGGGQKVSNRCFMLKLHEQLMQKIKEF